MASAFEVDHSQADEHLRREQGQHRQTADDEMDRQQLNSEDHPASLPARRPGPPGGIVAR